MRLVSALYNEFYPFEYLADECVVAQEPADLQKGDILVVWGGADIHPSLYNKGRSSFSYASREVSHRDAAEWALIKRNAELGNVTIGVCRGAQMLCAAAGGTLIQHVDNHSGTHEVDTDDDNTFTVNSIHHQMMNPEGTEHRLIAWSSQVLSNCHMDVINGKDADVVVQREPELIYFNGIKGLAPQWHPEMLGYNTRANVYLREKLGEILA